MAHGAVHVWVHGPLVSLDHGSHPLVVEDSLVAVEAAQPYFKTAAAASDVFSLSS